MSIQDSLNNSVNIIYLNAEEINDIQQLIENITSEYSSAENEQFLQNVNILAHELPRRLCCFLNNLKLNENSSACLIKGYKIDDSKLIKTPTVQNVVLEKSSTLNEEIFLVLCGSLLGEVFNWAKGLENVKIIQDIVPVQGSEKEQISASSNKDLVWHTEDTFHPCRADYLGLMCLRNPDKVATTFASIDMVNLEPNHMKVLFAPRFGLYQEKTNFQNLKLDSIKLPVLFGNHQSPYIRLDPLYMRPSSDDEAANVALSELIRVIDENLQDIVLQPGDICFIDNYKAVHGRKAFYARYDGNDRWLKRILLTRDLRKSRQYRTSSNSRILL
jgi:Taurine catabolism dioxygenase TauD, TfdA family